MPLLQGVADGVCVQDVTDETKQRTFLYLVLIRSGPSDWYAVEGVARCRSVASRATLFDVRRVADSSSGQCGPLVGSQMKGEVYECTNVVVCRS